MMMQIQWHKELDSTNAEAIRQASPNVQWIAAEAQTQGRGRHGRAWESPKGNLMASLWLPNVALACAHELAFVAGLAVQKLLASLLPQMEEEVRLKWPNDVLIGGKKSAGILLETASQQDEQTALVVGIGVNLAHKPAKALWPACCVADFGATPPAPQEGLQELAQHFAHYYAQWQAEGFAPLRDQWLAHAYGLGTQLQVRLGTRVCAGVFQGLTSTGGLELKSEAGVQTILAGDVFFKPQA